MGKTTIFIGENKDTDQLRSNCEADQGLCFRYMDSTIPLLSKSKISSPGLEIFLRTYSSCGASCKQFSLVLTAGALVLKIWILKETKIIKNCFTLAFLYLLGAVQNHPRLADRIF